LIFGIVLFSLIGFTYVLLVKTDLAWGYGFLGLFILLWDIVRWTAIGFWFVFKRGGYAILIAPFVYLFIKYFIHNEKVALKELGSKHRYWFKITTTEDGYLLHQDRLLGLLKSPIYLDKTTVQYFREHGTEQIDKEAGQKDKHYLEVDIVPLSWRGDSLLITNEQTKQQFINNALCVTAYIRDYYNLVVKGFSPSDRESEKGIIYDKILNKAELESQIIKLKRENKEMDIQHLEKVAEYLIPSTSDEFLRHKGLLKVGTADYDPLSKKIQQKAAMQDILQKAKGKPILTDEELIKYVADEELD
jgi:hypothetical protein